MSNTNKEIVRRKFDELVSAGNVAVLDEVFAEGIVSHDPTEREPLRGRDQYRASVMEILAAFPGLQLRIDDQVAEGEKVATRWSFTGRHEGELFGIPATGRDVTFSGIDIHRIADGRIVEEWSHWDALGLMRQLGVVSEAPQ